MGIIFDKAFGNRQKSGCRYFLTYIIKSGNRKRTVNNIIAVKIFKVILCLICRLIYINEYCIYCNICGRHLERCKINRGCSLFIEAPYYLLPFGSSRRCRDCGFGNACFVLIVLCFAELSCCIGINKLYAVFISGVVSLEYKVTVFDSTYRNSAGMSRIFAETYAFLCGKFLRGNYFVVLALCGLCK